MSIHDLSRRGVLSLGLAATGGLALAACGANNAPTNTNPAGNAPGSVPKYQPHPGLANIDGMIKSTNPLGPNAYTKYPKQFQSVAQVPGKGEEVSVFSLVWGAPPPPVEKNKYTQAIEKAMGVKLKYAYTASDGYEQKLATMLAGGSLPDLTWMLPRGSAPTSQALAQGAFADLTDVLGGDGVLKYPNLANIPTASWERSMFQGRVMGVPRALWLMNNFPVWRTDWIKAAGLSAQPQGPDEVFEVMTAMSNGKRWALGTLDTVGSSASSWMFSMFGVPHSWVVGSDGSFTPYFETPEFEAALEYEIKSWKAGHFHPDALLNQSQGQTTGDLFKGGKTGIFTTGVYGWYGKDGAWDTLMVNDPKATAEAFITPGHDGKPPVFYQGPGWYGMVAISAEAAKDPARRDMLLRVLDYQVAPFGSTEYTLTNFGIEGHNFAFGADGNPGPVPGVEKNDELNGKYFISPTEVNIYNSGRLERTETIMKLVTTLLDNSTSDPTSVLYSDTVITEGANLSDLSKDYHNQMVSGRLSMTEGLKKWREEWAKLGGDKARKEYAEAYAKTQ